MTKNPSKEQLHPSTATTCPNSPTPASYSQAVQHRRQQVMITRSTARAYNPKCRHCQQAANLSSDTHAERGSTVLPACWTSQGAVQRSVGWLHTHPCVVQLVDHLPTCTLLKSVVAAAVTATAAATASAAASPSATAAAADAACFCLLLIGAARSSVQLPCDTLRLQPRRAELR